MTSEQKPPQDSMGPVPTPGKKPSMALPPEWIEKLFSRLGALYGSKHLDQWAGQDIAVVKETWAATLGQFDGDHIAGALRKLATSGSPFPPTLPEFIALCQVARGSTLPVHQPLPALPKPENTAELREARERCFANLQKFRTAEPSREWAVRAYERHLTGEHKQTETGLRIILRALPDDAIMGKMREAA